MSIKGNWRRHGSEVVIRWYQRFFSLRFATRHRGFAAQFCGPQREKNLWHQGNPRVMCERIRVNLCLFKVRLFFSAQRADFQRLVNFKIRNTTLTSTVCFPTPVTSKVNTKECRIVCEALKNIRDLRTFAPIVSARPYCARESRATSCHVMHRARALSTKMSK